MSIIRKITQSPYLTLASGLILMGTSGYEIIDTLDQPVVGAHHGIFVFSLIQVFKVFDEILHELRGISQIEKAEDEKHKEQRHE